MPDVIAQVTIRSGRVAYPPGSVVTIESPEEAANLVARGDAEWAGDGEVSSPAAGGATPLPEDFPGRRELFAAGFKTIEAVRGIKDFDEIKGIGQTREEQILAYLEELAEEEDDEEGE